MPVISVTLMEGYDEAVREDLSHRLYDAARLVTGAPADGVTVILNEVPASNYRRGRQRRVPGAPPAAPSALVRDYLAAMEARDLDAAKGFLGDGFTMTFPGAQRFTTLEQLVEWGSSRYRSIAKTYERFDDVAGAEGATVYCYGTLSGEWLDGTAFAGIRFIDRFEIANGRLTDQQVWNDLAEERAAR